jgi:adenine-specific DNA-methyltransferase
MSRESSVDDPFLARQLIPYLGNKRALLRYMKPVFASLVSGHAIPLFIDPFAGSGSVSRLARSMGMAVRANDWEPYSESINRCWLELAPADLDAAFATVGGVEDFLLDWNRMHPLDNHGKRDPAPILTHPAALSERRYMARWYAPASTDQPDLDAERLFYSAENAVFIDRVRYRLEDEYPTQEAGSPGETRRRVVLGTILLEAATHTNTSGVFKAYHRGFGGHGSDALHRILARMELEKPLLVDAPPAIVHREDAAAFCSRYSADLAYIDPPYNQHQYGANYHILNTIVRWDGQPQSLDRGEDGRLLRKAGIPGAASLTKSPYCSRKGASSALAGLFNALDCAAMVVSWNGDAHLSATELAEMLSARGELRIEHLDHASYRGGRQSASKVNRSSEYLFIVDCRKPPIPSGRALSRLAMEQDLERAMGASYDPARLRMNFKTVEPGLLLDLALQPDSGMMIAPAVKLLPMRHLRKLEHEARSILGSLQKDDLAATLRRLETCVCTGVVDELEVLADIAAAKVSTAPGASQVARREAPRLIRKLAHRKYQDELRVALLKFRGIAIATNDRILSEALDELEKIATARFSYDPDPVDS